MPWSVFTSEVTWLGKMSWRLSQAVQWWSNMEEPPSGLLAWVIWADTSSVTGQ